MKYVVIRSDTLLDLGKMVKHLLNEGWKCQGGIAVSGVGTSIVYYYQAMTKE